MPTQEQTQTQTGTPAKGWFTLTKITTSVIWGEIPLTPYDANKLLSRAESKGNARFTVEQDGVQVAAFPKEVRQ